jgi:hypothetical protein
VIEPILNNINQSSESNFLIFIRRCWEFYNEKYFESKLKVPIFSLMKITKHKTRTLGLFVTFSNGNQPLIKISKKYYIVAAQKGDLGKIAFRNTLLHEMCHQAAWNETGKNHGHDNFWKKWMRHCGLQADRLISKEESELLKTEDELKDLEKSNLEKSLAQHVKDFKEEKLVKFYDLKKGWTIGIISFVGKNKVIINHDNVKPGYFSIIKKENVFELDKAKDVVAYRTIDSLKRRFLSTNNYLKNTERGIKYSLKL